MQLKKLHYIAHGNLKMGISGRIKINNHERGYLVHGQPFTLQLEFSNVKWGIVFYRPATMLANYHKARTHKPGSRIFGANIPVLTYFKIIRGIDEISLISNAYYPQINVILFSSIFNFSPERLTIPLKINFLNTRDINTQHYLSVVCHSPTLDVKTQTKRNQEFELTLRENNISIQSFGSPNLSSFVNNPELQSLYNHQ